MIPLGAHVQISRLLHIYPQPFHMVFFSVYLARFLSFWCNKINFSTQITAQEVVLVAHLPSNYALLISID